MTYLYFSKYPDVICSSSHLCILLNLTLVEIWASFVHDNLLQTCSHEEPVLSDVIEERKHHELNSQTAHNQCLQMMV